MIATILGLWALLSMFYIHSGINFIDKIKNPFKVCFFAILLGPVFWGFLILIGVVYIMITVFDGISKITTPISQKIKDWWTA